MKNHRLLVISALGISMLLSACGGSSTPASSSQSQPSQPSSSSTIPSSSSTSSTKQNSSSYSESVTPTPTPDPSSSSEQTKNFESKKYVEAINRIPSVEELVYGQAVQGPKRKQVEIDPSSKPEEYLNHDALSYHQLFQLRPYEQAVFSAKDVVNSLDGQPIKEGEWVYRSGVKYYVVSTENSLDFERLTDLYYMKITVSFDEDGKSTIDYLSVSNNEPIFGTASTFYTYVHYVEGDYVRFDYTLSAYIKGETYGVTTYPDREERSIYHLYSDLKRGKNVSFAKGSKTYRLDDGSLFSDNGFEVFHVEEVEGCFVSIRTMPAEDYITEEGYHIVTPEHNFIMVFNNEAKLLYDCWFIDSPRQEGDVARHLKLNIYEAFSNWEGIRYDDEAVLDRDAEVKVGEEWIKSTSLYDIQVDVDHYFGKQTPLLVCDVLQFADVLQQTGLESTLPSSPLEFYLQSKEQFKTRSMFGITYDEFTGLTPERFAELFPEDGYTFEQIMDIIDLHEDEEKEEPAADPSEEPSADPEVTPATEGEEGGVPSTDPSQEPSAGEETTPETEGAEDGSLPE